MEERLERQAANEALTRSVNQRLASIDEHATVWAEPGHLFQFVCECGAGKGCTARVEMTLEEYDRVRAEDDRFALVPGHQTAALERIVEQHERFLIVDKRQEFEPAVRDSEAETS
jgi:hypothetical protein